MASPRASGTKVEGALLAIGEVVRETGVQAHVLRYWEARGAPIAPVKRAGARRLYRAEDVAVIRRLDHLLHKEGFTLDGAIRALRSGRGAARAPEHDAAAPAAALSPPAGGRMSGTKDAELVRVLRQLRDRLARALAA